MKDDQYSNLLLASDWLLHHLKQWFIAQKCHPLELWLKFINTYLNKRMFFVNMYTALLQLWMSLKKVLWVNKSGTVLWKQTWFGLWSAERGMALPSLSHITPLESPTLATVSLSPHTTATSAVEPERCNDTPWTPNQGHKVLTVILSENIWPKEYAYQIWTMYLRKIQKLQAKIQFTDRHTGRQMSRPKIEHLTKKVGDAKYQ